MYGAEKNKHVIHSRLMNEFDKFEAKEGKSLDSVYKRLSTVVNVMDHNNVRPMKVSINTRFLNSLQPKWTKYVTLTRQNKDLSDVEYVSLYDELLQFEPHVQESNAKRAAKNHVPLALIAHSNASSSQSNAIDSEVDYQRELQGDAQEDKLTTAMMLLARVDIETKNAGYGRNGNRNAGRQNKNQAANVGNNQVQQNDESNQIVQRVTRTESNPGRANVQCYNCNVKGYYALDCPKPKVCDAKYFREQMLLAMKDEAGGTLNEEENDFMLDNAYGDETLEELTVAVIMMA
ncbi:retrovirus-related pol polyprotein from transposon TNT 1-94 [Tanacetum coccineum]